VVKFIPLNTAEEDNEISWYTAAAAGIASGIIKIPEGVVSLAAELIDLGADTNTAAEVENFFDKINPFEEIAEERAIGKITETLLSIGVPGAAGFKLGTKLANKALTAKKTGNYAKLGSKNVYKGTAMADQLNKKVGRQKFIAGIMGGATGETFVADVDEIGSFGDLFGGPTGLDREEGETNREEATRKLLNRLKFGSESLLITPAVVGVGKGAKALATRGQELVYSNSKFERWVDKYIGAPFRPRGDLPLEVFEAEMQKQGLKSKDVQQAKDIVRNITKVVDSIFPDTKKILDKSGKTEKEIFLDKINDILFKGDLNNPLNPKAVDDLVNSMKLKNISEATRQNIVTALNTARGEFTNLISIINKNITKADKMPKAIEELQGILQDRIKNWTGTTYKIFERPQGIFGFTKAYTPTSEAYDKAVKLFERNIANNAPIKDAGKDFSLEAAAQVDDIIEQVSKKSNPGALPDLRYVDITMAGQEKRTFDELVSQDFFGKDSKKIFRELFGEIKDPRYSIYNTMASLSTVARLAANLDDIFLKNKAVQKEGKKGFFWDTEELGKQAVNASETKIDLVNINEVLQKLPGGKKIISPFSDEAVTTREIADALLVANDVPMGLAGFVRGRETASGAEQAVSFLYRYLLLFPKGISQMSKTILSVPTHLRNFFSAGAFAGANGVMFENPKLLAKAMSDALDTTGLLKFEVNSPRAQQAYRDGLELGLANTQVQIGDYKGLINTLQKGEQGIDIDSSLRPFMSRLKKLGNFLQGKYVAEDDTWKFTNFAVELDRLKKADMKRLKLSAAEYEKRIFQKQLPDGTLERNPYLWELKEQAANIVKNTVPNYAYVGAVVKTSRLLPIGNFMSFPSEVIRTTVNIAEQGLKELRHSRPTIGSNVTPWVFDKKLGKLVKNDNIMYGTGLKRISGMATTLTAVPVAVTEGAKALYNVTEEEINALRQFVPDWSKNSTIIPVRDDDGELRYIDFSHSNAYDVIGRPFRTLFNNIMEGSENGDTLLNSFVNGVGEASAEIMNPFISESIWTEAITDLVVRGGRTREGKLLYTDQTSAGDKAKIRFLHLGEALAPSYKQFQRLGEASFGIPTKTGEQLEIGPELAGFMGLRPIKVDPIKSMGFKISEYQAGIRNARREFTGGYFGLLSGGKVTPDDIIKAYIASNAARFNVQKEMFKNINAAEILGVSSNELFKEFKERQLTGSTFNNLRKGNFESYYPSLEIQQKFKEIADNLGETNPFMEAAPVLRQIQRDMSTIPLSKPFDLNIDNYISNDLSEFMSQMIPQGIGNTPPPNPAVVGQAPNLAQMVPGTGAQIGVQNNGLTPSEIAYLTPEEQQIRLRQRGLG
jgi:hypothetical protein